MSPFQVVDIFKSEKRYGRYLQERELEPNQVPQDCKYIGELNSCHIHYSSYTGNAYLSAKDKKLVYVRTKKEEYENFCVTLLEDLPKKVISAGLTLLVTNKCNGACKYCYSAYSRDSSVMDFKTAKTAIDYKLSLQKEKVHTTFFGGGEPTLALGLIKKVNEYLEEKNAKGRTRILTNGILEDSTLDWISEHIDQIVVSCDGPPYIQDKQRPLPNGKKSSPFVEKTIRKLVSRERDKLSIAITISEYSVDKQEEIINYLHGLGVKKIDFGQVTCMNNGLIGKTPYNRGPNTHEFFKYYLKATELAEDYGISVNYRYFVPPDNLWTCAVNFCVRTDGSLTMCTRAAGDKTPLEKKTTYGKITNGAVIINQSYRNELLKRNTLQLPFCKNCIIRFNCVGYCIFDCEEIGMMLERKKEVCDNKKKLAINHIYHRLDKNVFKKYGRLEYTRGELYYRTFFNKYNLSLVDDQEFQTGKAFFRVELSEKTDLKQLSNNIISTKKSLFPKTTLFVLSIKRKPIGALKSFMTELEREKAWYLITRPIPPCISKEKIENPKIPKDCFECKELFTVLKDKRIQYCNGKYGQNIDDYPDRKSICSEFQQNIQRDDGKCKTCVDRLRSNCKGFPCRQ